MSYSEKYAGTEWGRPVPPPLAPLPPRSRITLVFVGLVVVLIVGAGIGLVNLALAPSRPAGLIGTATPTTGLGSSGPSAASPTPTPTADPGLAIRARFWALVSAPDVSYHLNANGAWTNRYVARHKTIRGSFTESLDIVGDTYSGSFAPSGVPRRTIARKGGVAWVRPAGGPRVARRTQDRYYRFSPFLDLRFAAWLDYVKPVTVDGRHLHLLRSNTFYRPDVARMLGLIAFKVEPDTMVLELYVTDEGVPVSATFTVAVDVAYTDMQQIFHGHANFSFARFGQPFKIVVPKP